MYEVRPPTTSDAPALVALMKREGSPCFCRYWHFAGTSKEWEARCAFAAEENERELVGAMVSGSDEARGLIAKHEGVVVGWMKLTWRASLPKLTARVPYRALDAGASAVAAERVLSIGCFVVDPAMRRRGVARALVAGAIEWGAKWDAAAIEAYPRRSDHPLHDGEAWMGPERVFAELGFTVVRDAPQYPVLRRSLRA